MEKLTKSRTSMLVIITFSLFFADFVGMDLSGQGLTDKNPIIDHDYGLTPKNPVMTGGGPEGEKEYLRNLFCEDALTISFKRTGSHFGFGVTELREIYSSDGKHKLVDSYEVVCADGKHRATLYLYMYEKREFHAPRGFRFKDSIPNISKDKLAAINGLAKKKDTNVIEYLVGYLDDVDSQVSDVARHAILSYGTDCIPSLCKIYITQTDSIRKTIGSIVTIIGNEALPVLFDIFSNKIILQENTKENGENDRGTAIVLMDKIETKESISSLMQISESYLVGKQSYMMYYQLEPDPLYKIVFGILTHKGEQKAIDLYIKRLEDINKSQAVITQYLILLESFKSKKAIEPAIKILESGNQDNRVVSVMILRDLGDPDAVVPYLIRALADIDVTVRTAAAVALGRVGDERAIEPLEKAIQDENPTVKIKARDALTVIMKRKQEGKVNNKFKETGKSVENAIMISDTDSEKIQIQNMKHECGGTYEQLNVSLIPREGRLYHAINVKCIKCNVEEKIYFDVTAVFLK